jgi:type 1 glutamine amidotransferase
MSMNGFSPSVAALAVLIGCAGTAAQAPAPPLKVCLVSASAEYQSHESMAALQKHLEANGGIQCTRAFGEDKGKDIPGLEALDASDVMVLFTRRVTLDEAPLARVKRFCAAGKGVVGIRTASHGIQNWLEIDAELFGGSYKGHYGKDEPAQVVLEEKAKGHPVLAGVKPFGTNGKLYKNPAVAADATLLLAGVAAGKQEPVAWVRERPGGRVFYTSLGVPEDFRNEDFLRLMANAVFWSAKREPKPVER